jgi:hypothetical protein
MNTILGLTPKNLLVLLLLGLVMIFLFTPIYSLPAWAVICGVTYYRPYKTYHHRKIEDIRILVPEKQDTETPIIDVVVVALLLILGGLLAGKWL